MGAIGSVTLAILVGILSGDSTAKVEVARATATAAPPRISPSGDYLEFANERHFHDVVAMLWSMTEEGRASWEQGLGFESMRAEYSKTLLAEERYFANPRAKRNETARTSASTIAPVAFNSRAVIVAGTPDLGYYFELNAPSEAIGSVVNPGGVVKIGSELFEYNREGRTRHDPTVSAKLSRRAEPVPPNEAGAATASGVSSRVSHGQPVIPSAGPWVASRYATADKCKIILYVNFDQTVSGHFIQTGLRITVRSLRRTTAGWYSNDKASITLSGHYAANRFPNPANAAWNLSSYGTVHTFQYQVFTDSADTTSGPPIELYQGAVHATRSGCAHGVGTQITWP